MNLSFDDLLEWVDAELTKHAACTGRCHLRTDLEKVKDSLNDWHGSVEQPLHFGCSIIGARSEMPEPFVQHDESEEHSCILCGAMHERCCTDRLICPPETS